MTDGRHDLVDLGEVARMLRGLIEALPPVTGRNRVTARRIEGAALALAKLASTASVNGRD